MSSIPLPVLHQNPIERPESPLSTYGQLLGIQNQQQQIQQRQQLAPLQLQDAQQTAQSGQIDLQQKQQSMQDQQTFRTAMADPSNHGKTIGQVADTLADAGHISPQSWQAMKKADVDQRTALATLDEKSLANAKAAHSATQDLYNNAMNLSDDQLAHNWPAIAQQYDAIPGNNKQPLDPSQPLTKQQLQQFGPLIPMQGAYIDEELARREKQATLQTTQATLEQKQAETSFYQQNGGAPGVPVEAQQQADWLKKNPGKGPSDYKLWTLKNAPSAMIMGNTFQQGDPGLDFAAQNYRQTGQLPAGFSRSPGTTKAIIDRAAQLDASAGGSGVAANKAVLGSLTDALKKVQTTASTVGAFEATAEKNMDLLQQTAAKIPDLGARFANIPVRMISGSMIGTDNMASFHAALATAQTEAAKVLNSSNASGVLSDSARHELQGIIDGNMPYSAMVASMNTLKQDMHNRNQAYQLQIQDLQGRIKGNATTQPAAQPSAVENWVRDPSGNLVKQ